MPNDKPKGGRPRAAEPGAVVSTWVAVSEYDRVIRLARKHDMSVSTLVRSLLKLRLPPPSRG